MRTETTNTLVNSMILLLFSYVPRYIGIMCIAALHSPGACRRPSKTPITVIPSVSRRYRRLSEKQIPVCPNFGSVFVLWKEGVSKVGSRSGWAACDGDARDLRAIGQTPIQNTDKRRIAFRTDPDTKGRRAGLSWGIRECVPLPSDMPSVPC